MSPSDRDESTLGTDPWQGLDDTLFDHTEWASTQQGLADAVQQFETALAGVSAGDAKEEERLREVVRRLELKIVSLEETIRQKNEKKEQARVRLNGLLAEIENWQKNVQ